MANFDKLSLGIDIGTTSVKVCLVDENSNSSVFSTSEPTSADVRSSFGPTGAEQDVKKIIEALNSCLMRITEKKMKRVSCVSVSGQMHGVLMWQSEKQTGVADRQLRASETSNLITWEDKRATTEFLASLPKPDSHQQVSAGFGCVTLFWLMRNKPEMLVHYDCVGGIMDYVTAILCGIDRPVMSDQIAVSWGYFDSETRKWNSSILKDASFPVHLLPTVVESGTCIGRLVGDLWGIPQGTPVLSGLGDLQCSFASAVTQEHDAAMNISTSGQICYQVSCPGFQPPRTTTPSPISYFPYFQQTYLAVTASLNGGNVLKAFVEMLQSWMNTLGVNIPTEDIWQKLTSAASSQDKECRNHLEDNLPTIVPLLFGERHSPESSASVTGISKQNLALESVFRSLCKGLVGNLHQMMPQSMLIESGITRLMLTGSVVHKQPCVEDFVRELYSPLIVEVISEADASYGAAVVGLKYLQHSVR